MSSFVFETVIEMAVNLEACDWTMSRTTQDHRYYLPIRRLENIGNKNIGRIVSEAKIIVLRIGGLLTTRCCAG